MCIVKADAYGHGVEHIAREHQRLGARWFGVSNIEEALELRRYGIDRDILILGYTPPKMARMLSANCITQAVFSEDYAAALSAAAKENDCTVSCHLKVDTGMGRIGFNCRADRETSESLEEAKRICALEHLDFTGIFMHFCVADEGEDGEQFTREQYSRFTALLEALEHDGITFRWRHCCNSAATLEYPEMHLDMVRPGIILYGLSPSGILRGKHGLRPVMQLKSVVSMVKELEKGATVSYGRTFTAEHDMRVATVAMGYADGYPRILSGRQSLLLHGQYAPIIGRVCMDQLIIDVTDIPDVKAGDVVTAFGYDGENSISVDSLTDKMETINYELVCRMARRVPRVYRRAGKVISQTDYLL